MPSKDSDKASANRAAQARYRAAHPEKVAAQKAQYRVANPEKESARMARYRANNQGKIVAYKAQRHAEYKAFIDVRKLGAGCSTCGYNGDSGKLDYHHMDPGTKLFDVANGHHHTEAAVLSELAKCVVVCKPCHRILHNNQRTL